MDCFISYSHKDSEIARQISSVLNDLGISSFLAELSLVPGDDWSEEIWENLRMSNSVLFLASAQSCSSPYVQQELGGAKYDKKKIIPIVWDMSPSDLPGWVDRSHALNINGMEPFAAAEKLTSALSAAKQGKWDVQKVVLAVVVIAVLAYIASSIGSESSEVSDDPLACPNCSNKNDVFRMSPIPVDFRKLEAASHECSKCGYKADLESG